MLQTLPAHTGSVCIYARVVSNMLRMLDAKCLRDFHFTVEDGANGSWPLFGWGMSVALA
ncbi:hypothetical protein [Bradyrhizobium sp. dw_78]|uniref:hypothetical protein n=1 Tax=Bradyrhizobium sp. dw_78 TaxID=2719793 RepID=UPI001BD5279F|nr:hypothetical protein [Bradyrhizobium sp. dw_78]